MNKIIIAIDFTSSIISEMKLEKKNVKRFFFFWIGKAQKNSLIKETIQEA